MSHIIFIPCQHVLMQMFCSLIIISRKHIIYKDTVKISRKHIYHICNNKVCYLYIPLSVSNICICTYIYNDIVILTSLKDEQVVVFFSTYSFSWCSHMFLQYFILTDINYLTTCFFFFHNFDFPGFSEIHYCLFLQPVV